MSIQQREWARPRHLREVGPTAPDGRPMRVALQDGRDHLYVDGAGHFKLYTVSDEGYVFAVLIDRRNEVERVVPVAIGTDKYTGRPCLIEAGEHGEPWQPISVEHRAILVAYFNRPPRPPRGSGGTTPSNGGAPQRGFPSRKPALRGFPIRKPALRFG